MLRLHCCHQINDSADMPRRQPVYCNEHRPPGLPTLHQGMPVAVHAEEGEPVFVNQGWPQYDDTGRRSRRRVKKS